MLTAALVATLGLHLAFPASEVFDHADGSKDAAVWAASAAVAGVASLVLGLVVWALLHLVAEGRPALGPEDDGAVQSSPAAVAATVAPSSQQASRSACAGSPTTSTGAAAWRHPRPVVIFSMAWRAPPVSLLPCT